VARLFYISRKRQLLALMQLRAGFRSIVAPIAARLRQQEKASGCTGG
jgi:hypothetical protein